MISFPFHLQLKGQPRVYFRWSPRGGPVADPVFSPRAIQPRAFLPLQGAKYCLPDTALLNLHC